MEKKSLTLGTNEVLFLRTREGILKITDHKDIKKVTVCKITLERYYKERRAE
jgi:hypothetical protein